MRRTRTPTVSLQVYANHVRTMVAQHTAQHTLHQHTSPSCMLEHADVHILQRSEWLPEIEVFMHAVIRPASWLTSNRKERGQQGKACLLLS